MAHVEAQRPTQRYRYGADQSPVRGHMARMGSQVELRTGEGIRKADRGGDREGGNVLDVTSMSGFASENNQSSRSAMTRAAVCRHQGCNPSFLQSS